MNNNFLFEISQGLVARRNIFSKFTSLVKCCDKRKSLKIYIFRRSFYDQIPCSLAFLENFYTEFDPKIHFRRTTLEYKVWRLIRKGSEFFPVFLAFTSAFKPIVFFSKCPIFWKLKPFLFFAIYLMKIGNLAKVPLMA